MMTRELTEAQYRVFLFLHERILNGESLPTCREICKRFGYRSTKAASDHINALVKKGYVAREKGRARGLRLIRSPFEVPLLGRIAAGIPRDGIAVSDQRIALDPLAYGIRDRSKAFVLRVTGDSMVDRHIFEGDLVLFEHGAAPQNGDVVAALIDNEATLKTFMRKDGRIWLRAENSRYSDLIPALDLQIQGVGRAVIRLLNDS